MRFSLDACQKGLIKDIGGDLTGEITGLAGAAAKARKGVAAAPAKKKCKVDFPDSWDNDLTGKAARAAGRLNDDDDACVCATDRDKRYNYLAMTGGRPQGVRATICPDDLKEPNEGRDDGAAVFVVGFPRVNPTAPDGLHIYDRTHILADRFRGKWATDNLFTGYRQMNTSAMLRCENVMVKYLRKDEIVIYSGQLKYTLPTDTIPSGMRMIASTKSGAQLFDRLIPNKPGLAKRC